MRLRAGLGVALVVAASVACDTRSTGVASTTATVSIGDNFFNPASLTIAVGDTVQWVWGGGAGHEVRFNAAAGAPANCPLTGLGVCARVFPQAGTFGYYCSPHLPGMVGQVTVQ